MSSIFESFLATPEVTEALNERQFVAAMLEFEAALARAQASVGLIPQAAAQSIIGTCKVDLFDVPKLVRESSRSRCVASPLINSLRETVGLFNEEAAGFVHFGCSTQDVIDSAMALMTRHTLALIQADVAQAIATLLALAERHAGDPMLARTQLQPASLISFGWTCTQWAAPLVRCQQRLRTSAANALCVQLGGAVGTQAEMKGKGPQVMALMATELKLRAPAFVWQTQRDEWVALACELGLLVGSLGKIAKDISLLAQFEVAELAEPGTPCMVVLAAAQRLPQHVAALLATLPQEHERGLGNWQASLAEWPALLMSTHGAANAMAQLLAGLQVNSQRMRSNLEARRASLSAKASAEWFSPGLSEHAAELTRKQVLALRSSAQEAANQG